MDEEATSWVRRTKFSHTICHRLDSSKWCSLPLPIYPDGDHGLRPKSGPLLTTSSSLRSTFAEGQEKRGTPKLTKQRSASPLTQTNVSGTFKEARLDKKRFSTPYPRRKEPVSVASYNSITTKSGILGNLATVKVHNKCKTRKEHPWGGGERVMAVDAGDEGTVDLSKLFLGLRFAHGAHSRLYHGVYRDEPVAVKIIRIPDDDDDDNDDGETMAARLERQFVREVTHLSRLRCHPNVIKFMAACRDPPVFCVITEYLSEGSLRSYLRRPENRSLAMETLIRIALGIARGMEYIHSKGIIHRDLKPENVLISNDFDMKIADFGIACEETYCDPMGDDSGTFRWMAPEMIKHKPYGRKVDVYSFGLVLWELLTGTIPYEDMTPVQAAFAVVNKNLRPVIPGNCLPAMRALMEQCWASPPEKRPEFWQLVKVLEQFRSSLQNNGTLTLNLLPDFTCQDHKKGLLHWIQKLTPAHPSDAIGLKPKFA